ncbi:MAG: hypothetical protein V1836_01105 [Candidatus Aenigmatarchaeota archaeon]
MGLKDYYATAQVRSQWSTGLRVESLLHGLQYDLLLPSGKSLATFERIGTVMHGYEASRGDLSFRVRPGQHGNLAPELIVDFYVVAVDQKNELGGSLNKDGSNRLSLTDTQLSTRTANARTKLKAGLVGLGFNPDEKQFYEELYAEVGEELA